MRRAPRARLPRPACSRTGSASAASRRGAARDPGDEPRPRTVSSRPRTARRGPADRPDALPAATTQRPRRRPGSAPRRAPDRPGAAGSTRRRARSGVERRLLRLRSHPLSRSERQKVTASADRTARRGLVDRVAAELVQLGGQELAARHALVRRAHGSPSTAIAVSWSASSCRSSTSRSRRERSQPARSDASAAGPRTYRLRTSDPRPEAREHAAPRPGSAPGDVRAGGPVEWELRIGLRRVGPLLRVVDQPVADVDQLIGFGLSERRPAAPAKEDRQPGHEQRVDDARRRAAAQPAQTELDHLGRDVPSLFAEREREHRHPRVDPICGISARGRAGSRATDGARRALRASRQPPLPTRSAPRRGASSRSSGGPGRRSRAPTPRAGGRAPG